MSEAWRGILLAVAAAGILMVLFHHAVVRIYKARDWLARGAILVDVDTASEFADHHPRIAVSLPLELLVEHAGSIGERNSRIVVFAHSWWRGSKAARELRRLGFVDVFNAAGVHTKEELSMAAARAAPSVDTEIELSRGR